MRLKPLVILLLVMQALLVTFQAHALTTGKLDIFPDAVKNLRDLLIDLRNFATFDPKIFLKNQQMHSDLPPEIQAELASVSYGYNARAVTGVKGKFKEMSVLFQNPFSNNESDNDQTNAFNPPGSAFQKTPAPSLSALRRVRQQAREAMPKHLRGQAELPEYDIAYNKVTAPKRTGNSKSAR
jgi:hypothetical protein